jgi:hypothetical protein
VTHAARIPGEQLSLYDAVFYGHLCQKCRRSHIEPPRASRAGSSKPGRREKAPGTVPIPGASFS